MKIMLKKRIFPLIALALCLAVSTGCVSGYLATQLIGGASSVPQQPAQAPAKQGDWRSADHSVTGTYAGMEYAWPDIQGLEDALKQLSGDASKGRLAPDQLLDAYDRMLALYRKADSAESLAYLLYAKDVTTDTYKDQYGDLNNALTELDLVMTDVSMAILESEAYGDAARARWGTGFTDSVIAGENLNSAEIQQDMAREQELTFQYDGLITSFTVSKGGKAYAIEDLAPAYYAGELSYREYVELYDGYYAQLNAKAGAIFLDLVEVRSGIAAKLGYGSYAAYMYDCYSRDYTVTDAKALHRAVKEYLAPVFVEASELSYANSTGALEEASFSQAGFFDTFREVLSGFSPVMAQSLEDLVDRQLYDFDVSASKMEGSFTTYICDYDAPFIFTQWDGTGSSVQTVIHEFGHFTNYRLSSQYGWSVGDPLDLAEVDSQGLELLMLSHYDRFYGAEAAEEARFNALLDGMYAVISGCMEDEFQQEVYANPDMTLEEMNDLYYELSIDYGLGELYGFTGTEWAGIPHTFQSPLYYISYATSMILSMELWEQSTLDYNAARDDYVAILQRPAYSQLRAVARERGLGDPLAADTIRSLSALLKKTLTQG